MSRLRRTGTGDLRLPPLGPYPDTTSQIWQPHLTCPGTSSSGTAWFSTLLARAELLEPRDPGRDRCGEALLDGGKRGRTRVVGRDARHVERDAVGPVLDVGLRPER